MKLLGTAKLYEYINDATGKLVRAYDLTPWGELPVFLGAVTMPLPTGTTDRGNLRIELQTGKVFLLEAGDPPPTQGQPGVAFPTVPLIVGGALLLFWLGQSRRAG